MGSRINTVFLYELTKEELGNALKAGAWERGDQDYADALSDLLEYGEDSELLDVAGVRGHMWAQNGQVFVHFNKMRDALDREELDLRTLLKDKPGAAEVIIVAHNRINYGREQRRRTTKPATREPVTLPAPFLINRRLRVALVVGNLEIEFPMREEKVQLGARWTEVDVCGQLTDADETTVFTTYNLRVTYSTIAGGLVEAAHRVLHAISMDLDMYRRVGTDGTYLVNMAAGLWASRNEEALTEAVTVTHNLLMEMGS